MKQRQFSFKQKDSTKVVFIDVCLVSGSYCFVFWMHFLETHPRPSVFFWQLNIVSFNSVSTCNPTGQGKITARMVVFHVTFVFFIPDVCCLNMSVNLNSIIYHQTSNGQWIGFRILATHHIYVYNGWWFGTFFHILEIIIQMTNMFQWG